MKISGLPPERILLKRAKLILFLSIHCNAFNAKARGTETLISPVASGNTNHAAEKAFAQLIQKAVFKTVQSHDPKAVDRGVKDQSLGAIRDVNLGTKARGCMVELEFIDVKAVDQLLNIGPNSPQVRQDIAKAIAEALIVAL